MKDNYCNDSTSSSSFGSSLNIIVETAVTTLPEAASHGLTTATATETEPSDKSTSNTNLSSLTTLSQNDLNELNKLNKSPQIKINDTKFRLMFPDSDFDCDSNSTSSSEDDDLSIEQQHKRKTTALTRESFEHDYDKQVETIIEKAAKTIENDDSSSCIKCGFYQFLSFIFISMAWSIGNGWYAYINVFAGHSPKHVCDIPYGNYTNNFTSFTVDEEQCKYSNNVTNDVQECQKWTYDHSQMKSTIITEFDFVCNKNYKFETAYSLEQIGYVIGTLLFSIIADKYGRKPVFIGVLVSMTVLGIVQFFISNFYIYMCLGFVINVFASGLDSVCVPLVIEMVNTKRRTSFGMGMEYVWVLILTSLSLVAYLINTWRYLRLFVFAVLGVIAIASFWLVQESVTWLISTSKFKQASSVIDWVAKFNCLAGTTRYEKRKSKLDESFRVLKLYEDAKKRESSPGTAAAAAVQSSQTAVINQATTTTTTSSSKGVFMDIIRHPKYRLYVLIMSFTWFATGLIYDGLTYLNSFVGENIFLNWTLMNIVELPAQFICFICLSRFGRRLTTSVSLILCGATLIITAVISLTFKEISWLKLTLFVIAKFSSTQAYSAVILHAPEIFPTHLRSFGYGICLFSGKSTAVVSPIISLYLTKLFPWLPPVIYGLIAILCGFTCLYVPETLNRPLPNSVDDVIKWSRNLTAEEWKIARNENKIDCNLGKKFQKLFCKKQSIVTPKRIATQNTIILLSANDLQNKQEDEEETKTNLII